MIPPADQVAAARVLVVDDEPGNRELLTRLLRRHKYEVITAESSAAARQVLFASETLPDLILLDVMMPGLDGFAFCKELKRSPQTGLIPIVLLTGLDDKQSKLEGIVAGADDFLTKPIQFEELTARAASLVRLKRQTDDLESAESVILSLGLTVEARDPYTDGHCRRLAAYSSALGRTLGLGHDELAALERGAYLHDVGKIGLPDSILLKTSRLSTYEFTRMQAHTVIGERLCGTLRSLRSARLIVRHHHERIDGSGYPDGLRGDQIPLTAQIVGVVDAYDAMTTTRPYRTALDVGRACEELLRDVSLGRLNGDLVRMFLDLDRDAIRRDTCPLVSSVG